MTSTNKDDFTPALSGIYWINGRYVYLVGGTCYTMAQIMAMDAHDPSGKQDDRDNWAAFWDSMSGVLPGFSTEGIYDGLEAVAPSLRTEVCSHKWANYVGMFEAYEYCTLCNVKRNA